MTELAQLPAMPGMHGLELREEEPGHQDFLARLYASTREDELRETGWSEQQKAAFIAQQFAAQTMHYRRYYSEAARKIVTVEGTPAGRLYLLPMRGELRVVDISLLPEYRGRGIGTAVLRSVFDQARATGSIVSIHVEIFNPARRLYERLGFRPVREEGVYVLMHWKPDSEAN